MSGYETMYLEASRDAGEFAGNFKVKLFVDGDQISPFLDTGGKNQLNGVRAEVIIEGISRVGWRQITDIIDASETNTEILNKIYQLPWIK